MFEVLMNVESEGIEDNVYIISKVRHGGKLIRSFFHPTLYVIDVPEAGGMTSSEDFHLNARLRHFV